MAYAQAMSVGAADEPVPVKPNVVEALAASVPLWVSFFTVIALPDVVRRPFHTWLSVEPDGEVQVTVHEVMVAVLELRTTTSPWKPPCHELVMR